MDTQTTFHFADALIERVRALGTPCIVGLDPDLDRIPAAFRARFGGGTSLEADAETIWEYCRLAIDAVHDLVAAVKPQSAYFEVLGSAGIRALERTIAHARGRGLLVILDAKRGDIESTSEAYATAYLRRRSPRPQTVDCLTLSPYLGSDGLEPFVKACQSDGAGVFVCVKTSNRGSADFQDLPVDGGARLYLHVARLVDGWCRATVGRHGFGNVGAVVGATYPEAAAELRSALPHSIFLMPGLGAQGGSTAAARVALNQDGLGAIFSSSRAILYPPDLREACEPAVAVRRAALAFIDQMRTISAFGRR